MAKRRATYPKELRALAKERGHGLVTVSLETADGTLMEEQGTVDVLRGQFVKWAMALLFCEEVRATPDLERVVRNLISGN